MEYILKIRSRLNFFAIYMMFDDVFTNKSKVDNLEK